MRNSLILGTLLVALLAQTGCAMHVHSPNFGSNGLAPSANEPPALGLSQPGLIGPGLVVDVSDHALVADLR